MSENFQHLSLKRRQLLKLGVAGVAGLGACAQPADDAANVEATRMRGYDSSDSDVELSEPEEPTQIGGDEEPDSPWQVSGEMPLKERAAAKGILFGASTRYEHVVDDPGLATAYAHECAILVPGIETKMARLQPQPNQYDFEEADNLVEYARSNGMVVRGHTLVWHRSVPEWVEETINRQNAEQIMVDHITNVAEYFAGQFHSWDVINECLDADERYDLRKTIWSENIGPEFIEIAFRAAAQADPNTMLTLNTHKMEYPSRGEDKRQTAMLKLLEKQLSQGTPIHSIGLQAHLRGELNDDLDTVALRQFLKEIADMGLKILITELDVTDQDLPREIEQRDRLVADAYGEYLSVVLDEPAVTAVLTWGLSDRHTWLNSAQPRPDNAPVRSLPLDDKLDRKLAWHAVAKAFDNAPNRTV